MAENKIPVLTEVYKPKKSKKEEASQSAPLQLTPELIAQITAQVKSELEAEAPSPDLGELRAEIQNLRDELAAVSSDLANKLETDDASSSTIDALRTDLTVLRDEFASASLGDAEALAQTVSTQVKPRLETEITDFALDELRVEIKKAREDIITSTETFVDKIKADLKTEMPKMYQKSIDLAQIDLSEHITKLQSDANADIETTLSSVSDSLRQVETTQEQLILAHQTELSDTFDTLKKEVEGNLKTTVSAEVMEVQEQAMQDYKTQLSEALAGFLQIQGEEAEKTLLRNMQDYQEKLHIDYQEKLTGQVTDALETIKRRVEESTEEQIGIMHSQVGTIQQETFSKLRQDFNAEKDLVFSETASEITSSLAEKMNEKSHEINEQFLAKVNGNLPEVQKVLQDSIQAILDNTIPDLESRLRDEFTEEIKQLLLNVKFVLPD